MVSSELGRLESWYMGILDLQLSVLCSLCLSFLLFFGVRD